MTGGGDFSNPLIERQKYSSHYFFVYPPLHSYALMGWLKLLGVSALSMTGFPIFMCLVAAISTIAILRKHGAPPFMCWLVPLALCTALLPTGLRSEALSVGLTMAGLALTECAGGILAVNFIAFFLMILGASAAPRLMFFSGALVVASALNRMQEQTGSGRSRFPMLGALSAAFVCGVIVFLAQIHFRIGEFWHTFHEHAKLVPGRKLDGLIGFMNENPYVDGTQVPLVWLLWALLFFAWPGFKSKASRLGVALLTGFFLEMVAGGLGAGTLWYLLLALLLISIAVMDRVPVVRRKLTVTLVFLFLLANVQIAVFEYQRWMGRVTDDLGGQAQAALALRSTPDHQILIDSFTARYLYNYRLPEHFHDIEFAAAFPKSHVFQQWIPTDTYVIGPRNIQLFKRTTRFVQEIELRIVFGLPNHSLYLHPRSVFIVPADLCQPTGNMP